MSSEAFTSHKAKENIASTDRVKPGTYSVADTTTTFRADQTREKIVLFVANYKLAEDWLNCVAKFDSGCDDDWISEKLASRIGLKLTKTDPLKCITFDNTTFISDLKTEEMTWIHDKNPKSICGAFRVQKNAQYDIVIGRHTIFRENIFSTGEKIHNAGILVTKRISKEEAEKNRAESRRQREQSDALLKKQAEQQKKNEALALKKNKDLSRRDGHNKDASNSRR